MSIHDGLAYVADCAGNVHCVDVQTGQALWVHDAGNEIWASTLVADGKVFAGTRRGDFWILATGKEKRVLRSVRLDSPVHGTAVAANGTLTLNADGSFSYVPYPLFIGQDSFTYVANDGADTRFRVSFTPIKATWHTISVRFNGEDVPGN